MRLLDLPHVLRAAGQTVIETDQWQGRGDPLTELRAIVCHHTATKPSASDAAVARILIRGRSDLKGPLANLGLDRDGHWWLIAAGKANHNGPGQYGNQTVGIEAFNDGVGEPWPAVQIEAWTKGCAAICEHFGVPVDRVLAHRETDPGRKVDPKNLDMGWFRLQVAAHITQPVEASWLLLLTS